MPTPTNYLFDEGKNKRAGFTQSETSEKIIDSLNNSTIEQLPTKDKTIVKSIDDIFGDIYKTFVPNYLTGVVSEINSKISIYTGTTAWSYVIVDVSNFIGVTLVVSTYTDTNHKLFFADNENNVISSVSVDTGNPNNYSTVNATVPEGATKFYINKLVAGQNDVVVNGYYERKVAYIDEVPQMTNEFGSDSEKVIDQKTITENFNSVISSVCPLNNKIPVVSENVPIYLDNMFMGISPKTVKNIKCNNAHVLIYDKTVALLPYEYGTENAQMRLMLIDDYNHNQDIITNFGFVVVNELEATKKVLFIGDSITVNLSYLTPLNALSEAGDYKLTFLGTQGTTIKNEGRSGWAAYNYCNDQTFNGKTNAFWDGSKFNFSYYISQNNIETPDYIFICLGTNDLIRGISNPNDDEEVRTVITTNYQTMIDSIRGFSSNIPIVLWLPPTRSMIGRQSHAGIDNSLRANKFLIEKFDKNAYVNNKVYLMPTQLFVNPYTDYTSTTITIDGVQYEDCIEPIHPTSSGGEKIANGIMRQLMYIDDLLS